MKLNELPNVAVRPVGVGAVRTQLTFERNSGNVVVKNDDVKEGSGSTETIEIVSLDEDIDPNMRVDFMKIDVEGSDLEALKGARKILSQRPIIDFELHNFIFSDRIKTLQAIFEILDPHCYAYEVLPEIFSGIVKIEAQLIFNGSLSSTTRTSFVSRPISEVDIGSNRLVYGTKPGP